MTYMPNLPEAVLEWVFTWDTRSAVSSRPASHRGIFQIPMCLVGRHSHRHQARSYSPADCEDGVYLAQRSQLYVASPAASARLSHLG